MPRYIDEKDVYALVEPSGIARVHCSQIDKLPRADVVPKSEVDKWYHEYHAIKDELKQEKMYHRETEKLVDKYCTELEKANAEVDRLKYNLKAVLDEIPETKRELASEIFAEIQKSIVHNILHNESYSFEGVIDCITKDLDELKKKYTEETK